LRLLINAHGLDLSFAFAPDATQKVAAARRALELLGDYRDAERGLSVAYTADGVRRLNLLHFDAAWAEAGQKFWFLASLARKKVARNLAEQGGATGVSDPNRDLPNLHRMRKILDELDSLSPGLNGLPGWSSLSSDTARLGQSLDLAENLRAALSEMATSPEHLIELRRLVTTSLKQTSCSLGEEQLTQRPRGSRRLSPGSEMQPATSANSEQRIRKAAVISTD
jgi:hypothetical protein